MRAEDYTQIIVNLLMGGTVCSGEYRKKENNSDLI